MKLTLLGSLGNINRIVIPQLIRDGHEVTVVTSNPDRQAAIRALGAIPAVGTMTDETFLTQQFIGRDMVYLMISGSAPDLFAATVKQAQIFKHALQTADVHRVVNLSSIGAQDPRSGSLYAYHSIEDTLSSLPAVEVAFIRPTGFYNNLYANLDSIRHEHALYSNIPAVITRQYVSPTDIATVVTNTIRHFPAGKTIHYVTSDTFTGQELVNALSTALGFSVKYVEITDEQYKAALKQNGVPTSIIEPFVASSQLQRQPGELYADFANHPVYIGQVKLADFAVKFAAAYQAGEDGPHAQTIVSK